MALRACDQLCRCLSHADLALVVVDSVRNKISKYDYRDIPGYTIYGFQIQYPVYLITRLVRD